MKTKLSRTADNLTRAEIIEFRDSGNTYLGKARRVRLALDGDRNSRDRIAYILNVRDGAPSEGK